MITDLWGVVVPVLVSVVIMGGGAWAVRRYAGPAQAAYNVAMEGRLKMLQAERDEMEEKIEHLEREVQELRAKVADLDRQIRDLLTENLELRRLHAGRGGAARG